MKIIKTIILVAIFSSLFVGCGADSKKKSKKSQGVIPEHQLQSLEKARGVEKTIFEAEQKRRQ